MERKNLSCDLLQPTCTPLSTRTVHFLFYRKGVVFVTENNAFGPHIHPLVRLTHSSGLRFTLTVYDSYSAGLV